jgi:Putative zinc-finger
MSPEPAGNWAGQRGDNVRMGVAPACEEFREHLSARLDGEQPAAGLAAETAEQHLASCAECSAWWDKAVALTRLTRTAAALPGPALSEDAIAAILAESPASTQRPARTAIVVRLLRLALGADRQRRDHRSGAGQPNPVARSRPDRLPSTADHEHAPVPRPGATRRPPSAAALDSQRPQQRRRRRTPGHGPPTTRAPDVSATGHLSDATRRLETRRAGWLGQTVTDKVPVRPSCGRHAGASARPRDR